MFSVNSLGNSDDSSLVGFTPLPVSFCNKRYSMQDLPENPALMHLYFLLKMVES